MATALKSRTVSAKRSIASVAVFYNEAKPEAAGMMRMIVSELKSRGIRVWRERGRGGSGLEHADLAVAVGGDGTILRVARLLAPRSVPLWGVNSGGLGFLSGTDASEFKRHCEAVLAGRFVPENRWMIEAQAWRRGKKIFGPNIALNDVVIRCGDQARAISMRLSAGGRFMADYMGDGLIVSTPTGSTAYALAAAGPIVDPSLDVILLAPICPHTMTQRPLIVPGTAELSIHLTKRRAHEEPRVLLSFDGQIGCKLREGDEVRVRRYEKPFRLLLPPGRSCYDVLRRKLKWGER